MNAGIRISLLIVVMFAIFYFLLIRPQQKRQKAVLKCKMKSKKVILS